MGDENVRVAVRVRPFNQREKDANATLCVAMNGNQTIITNSKTNDEKKFAYDFSYWSFDGFKTDSSGYSSPDNPKYADQKKVYNDLGAGILKNAWNGYNASLFAYGQTGSGKSYSVVGYGTNKGIVPMICEEIFKQAPSVKDKTVEVTFSMLEIYSEITRDLLNPKSDKKQGLLIREDPKIGFYPQGLTKKLVDSYDSINKLTEEGTANRTIASTKMNATSSRAHTIVTVNLVQKYKVEEKEMAKSSLINLVDLAGSERADQTGATGDKLKEGAAINQSLSSLGNVISALADNSAGKNVRVPYRDSVLTKLLMNALGGNSKTIMIAAISPADINFDESLSTLRYADRAKQIKCKAIVNEDPTEKLIRDLQEENAKLKKLLADGKIDPNAYAAIKSDSGDNKANADKIKQEEEAMKKQLEENDKAMKAMQLSYEEKLAAAKAQEKQSKTGIILEKAKTIPHLSNINMDPSLSGTIKYLLEGDSKKIVGPYGKAEIGLHGIGILDPHCSISVNGGKFLIEKANSDAKVLKNGNPVTKPQDLIHLDRIVFGVSQYFQFIDPSKSVSKDQIYTFEMAQDEIAKASGLISSNTQNLSTEQIQSQAALVDLMPMIEEANTISIEMDKKIKYMAICVSADLRGEYDSKKEPFVSVKNFETGLEWIWTQKKFLNRKADFTAYYNDFKDDGIINTEKFKNYDPFFESSDTPTQIGTAIVTPKALANLIPIQGEFKIIDFLSKEAGLIKIELIPCDAQGKELPKSATVRNPQVELLNKELCFLIKISETKNVDPVFEEIYCQFQVQGDTTVYKTQIIKGNNEANFKFIKMFSFPVSQKILDYLLQSNFYVQVWGKQKIPEKNKNAVKMTTKEYFDKEKQNASLYISGKPITQIIDPEIEKLRNEIALYKKKEKNYEKMILSLQNLTESTETISINPIEIISSIINPNGIKFVPNNYNKHQKNISAACTIS